MPQPDQAAAAAQAGASGYTHLFNAMSGFDHRQPGIAGYALANAHYAELICDLVHVHPTVLHAACRAIPVAYAITDSTAAAGCPDGKYALGQSTVVKQGTTVKTPEGALAGTAMTLWQARENLLAIGLSELPST